MKNNKLLIMIIGIVSIILAIGLVVSILLLEMKGTQNIINNKEEQIINAEDSTKEQIYSVNEVIDNYQNYTGRIITIEGIAPQNLTNSQMAYIIDNSYKEDLLNQPIGQPKFNENKAILLKTTNRLENIPSIKYGDIIRVKGQYNTFIYAGVNYTYEIIVENIEVIGHIK